eukprot:scaffold180595_cov65-Cyclotella_meneghiniana.AAC.1
MPLGQALVPPLLGRRETVHVGRSIEIRNGNNGLWSLAFGCVVVVLDVGGVVGARGCGGGCGYCVVCVMEAGRR